MATYNKNLVVWLVLDDDGTFITDGLTTEVWDDDDERIGGMDWALEISDDELAARFDGAGHMIEITISSKLSVDTLAKMANAGANYVFG